MPCQSPVSGCASSPGSKFHSEVAHDAVVYYCKMLGLTWLLALLCWRTSTNWKECALTAPVGGGYAICSCSRTRTRTHRIVSCQTFALFYLHTSASSLAATPGVSMIITTMMIMMVMRMWLEGGEWEKGDIGMHKIYRLKLSQRLEAFKNDMSERLRCRKGVPPPTSTPPACCYHNHYYYYTLCCWLRKLIPIPKYADQVQLLMAHNLFIFNLN